MLYLYDSTLRDGAQAEGISFSVSDKISIVGALDGLGMHYIEAGNPFSNPKDMELFQKLSKIHFSSKIVAFGSTKRPDTRTESDKNLAALLEAQTDCVAIVGKSWHLHVMDVLQVGLKDNLQMIYDSVRFLKARGLEVIFDAEHFFDGYKANPSYALQTLEAAQSAGADCICLCDTNGGSFPNEIMVICGRVKETITVSLGIHCHNDCGLAIANTLAAVEAGVVQLQGTFTGFGERCGNTSLSTLIPNLQVKLGLSIIPHEKLSLLKQTAVFISETANISLSDRMPYVGRSAFAHKGGMHIDGVSKNPQSFEHINPSLVGNERRLLTSEMSGKSAVIAKIQSIEPNLGKSSLEIARILEQIKVLEYEGFQFEAADASFYLLVKKILGTYEPLFELINFKIIGEQPVGLNKSASAIIKIRKGDKTEISAAEGDGPVNALDKALRKALEVFYPEIKNIHLTDYKVRVLDNKETTASKVRVLIESTDGHRNWISVGASKDIIEASWLALVDSIEYGILQEDKYVGN